MKTLIKIIFSIFIISTIATSAFAIEKLHFVVPGGAGAGGCHRHGNCARHIHGCPNGSHDHAVPGLLGRERGSRTANGRSNRLEWIRDYLRSFGGSISCGDRPDTDFRLQDVDSCGNENGGRMIGFPASFPAGLTKGNE